MTKHTEIRDLFENAGQGQVFRYWDELGAEARETLLRQAGLIDLAEIDRLNQSLVQGGGTAQGPDLHKLSPAPYVPLPSKGGDAALWEAAFQLGEQVLREGKVAAFTVAGGQGTRLGYDGPKGTFPVTPVRQASLFQVFAEKIQAAGKRYGQALHWFIMTSHINHEATEKAFREHDYFGLDASKVHFFRQGLMPAVDKKGKIMLEDKGAIAMSPDGHGGSLRALVRSGATALMRNEGIEILSYFQVDNPLVKCIDPAFIGFHVRERSQMSSKMVPKAYAGEKVGHFCQQADQLVVIEYSDMPEELAQKKDASGELLYRAGSIAIHLLDRDFVETMGGDQADSALPFHRADKKIRTLDAQGNSWQPEKPNGIKFELFVFDALPFARNPVIIETAREDDFSPVKNADGQDSPQSCRDDQLREYTRWLKKAGLAIPTDATGLPPFAFEISPLFADSERTFLEKWASLDPKPEIAPGTIVA